LSKSFFFKKKYEFNEKKNYQNFIAQWRHFFFQKKKFFKQHKYKANSKTGIKKKKLLFSFL